MKATEWLAARYDNEILIFLTRFCDERPGPITERTTLFEAYVRAHQRGLLAGAMPPGINKSNYWARRAMSYQVFCQRLARAGLKIMFHDHGGLRSHGPGRKRTVSIADLELKPLPDERPARLPRDPSKRESSLPAIRAYMEQHGPATAKQIAEDLGISFSVVHKHFRNKPKLFNTFGNGLWMIANPPSPNRHAGGNERTQRPAKPATL